jgi:hypothetical protein
MTELKQLLESHQDINYPKVVRNEEGVILARECTVIELERLLEIYRGLTEVNQKARLVRDGIDFWLRRYHGYAIQGSLGGHYREAGVRTELCDFEHIIPQKTIRDLLIHGKLTINQAMNAPTCQLTKDKHQMLKEQGWASMTPSTWHFFDRYTNIFPISLETYNGQPITDPHAWTLQTHYDFFGIQ